MLDAVTVRLTGMLTVVPPVGAIRMLPWYVAGGNALELTLIVKGFNGAVPAATLAESQLPPLLVIGVTVKEIPAAPAALLTLRVWFAGLEPCTAAKASEPGKTVMFPAVPPPLTAKLTLTVCTAPLALKEMVALYVVPAVKPAGLAETVRLAGVVPDCGLTVSQPEPLV